MCSYRVLADNRSEFASTKSPKKSTRSHHRTYSQNYAQNISLLKKSNDEVNYTFNDDQIINIRTENSAITEPGFIQNNNKNTTSVNNNQTLWNLTARVNADSKNKWENSPTKAMQGSYAGKIVKISKLRQSAMPILNKWSLKSSNVTFNESKWEIVPYTISTLPTSAHNSTKNSTQLNNLVASVQTDIYWSRNIGGEYVQSEISKEEAIWEELLHKISTQINNQSRKTSPKKSEALINSNYSVSLPDL